MNETRTYVKPKRPNVLFWGIKNDFKKIKKHIGANTRTNVKNFLKDPWIKNKFYKYLFKNKKFKSYVETGLKDNIILEEKKRIQFLKKINCYRGKRHNCFLSVRGQRTKTNCKTQRKYRRKKKDAKKLFKTQKKKDAKKKKN